MRTAVLMIGRQADYWWIAYRRTWLGTAVTSFLSPLFYVLAMGVLLGGFIKVDPARLEGASSYLDFIVPGLLVAQTMQVAVGESTYPVYGNLKWNRVLFGMYATPLRPLDIVNANLVAITVRLTASSAVFLLVLAPFGVLHSVGGAVAAWLVAVLVGMAIAMPVYAFSVGTRSEAPFALVFRLGVIPQFLFSGAFFPVSNLSPALEFLAKLTPLWHGVDLARMLTLGTWETGPALIHLAYLVVLCVVFHRLAVRRLTRRLTA